MTVWQAIVVAVVITVCWQSAPVAWRVYQRRAADIAPKTRFVGDERVHDLTRDYPTIMGEVVTDCHHELAEGAVGPALERAWEESWVRATLLYVSRNAFVRIFSPENFQEHCALVGLVCFALWCVVHFGGIAYKARTFRMNTEMAMSAVAATSAMAKMRDTGVAAA